MGIGVFGVTDFFVIVIIDVIGVEGVVYFMFVIMMI